MPAKKSSNESAFKKTPKIRTNKLNFKYYSFDSLLSRNGVFNFCVGQRGNGKTYGCKKWGITSFLNTGEQFIYLRRYEDEMKTSKATFFADIENAFPGVLFRVVGMLGQVCRNPGAGDKEKKWETMCFFVVLSKASQTKSVSYDKVTKIFFDEFIIPPGMVRYLPSEATAFLEFYNTVDRWKDKTRVMFLANTVSINNPYFLYFGIEPAPQQEWLSMGENFLVCHFIPAGEFAGQVYETRFGKFIKGTEYANYAVEAEFKDNHQSLVGKRPSAATYLMTLEGDAGTFALWWDLGGKTFYVSTRRPKQEDIYVMELERMEEGKNLIERNSRVMQNIRGGYAQGKVYFDSAQARNAFAGIFKS